MRGKPILLQLEPEDTCEQFKLIGAATLFCGVYHAVEKAPESEQVQETLRQGLECCLLLEFGTPRDVLTELMFIGNIDHDGSTATFIQGWHSTPDAQSSWEAVCLADRITKRSCPTSGPDSYSKRQERHILEEFQHLYAKGEQFEQA